MEKRKVVIFDFDGVIADSLMSAYSTWKEAGATITLDEYRARFDGNINHSFKPAPIDFHEHYQHKVKNLNIFPGMAKVIVELASEYILVIVSSTITDFIETVLKNNNIRSQFDAILGNDVATSKVEKFKMVFEKYDATASNCVLITDTSGDMREASLVNLRTIGVTWGYQKSETLFKMNPAALVNKPSEIIPAANRLLK